MPIPVTIDVEESEAGLRLDVFLAGAVEDATRSFLKKLIKDGVVLINDHPCAKPSQTVNLGDTVHLVLPDPPPVQPEPEDLPLDILHEDDDVVVVNKAAGMVVHPAPGHERGTLVNALLHHCPDYQQSGGDPGRPGIVHRLDRDTSGVMVAAKNARAYTHLARQASDHAFERRYLALARGEFKETHGCINAGMGRSLSDPSRMAVTGIRAKEAITYFETRERFGLACLVALRLETGRTHQIRVHLRFAGHPVLGDPVYGETRYQGWPLAPEAREALQNLRGQALHAEHLGFIHPISGDMLRFDAPVPEDFQAALDALRRHAETTNKDSS